MANKNVYFFGAGKADGNGSKEMVNLLGGKGANLAEMNNLVFRFPPVSPSPQKCARSITSTKASFPGTHQRNETT